MLDKAALGTRYTCFQCRVKFYDLNRPEPTCPECGTDQREAPVRDVRALLGKGRKGKTTPSDDDLKETRPKDLDEDDDDDDLGLLDDDDDDGGDDDDDDDGGDDDGDDW